MSAPLWPLPERAAACVSAPQRLARSPLLLLVGLQLLLALTVAAGVWATSAHLRRLALDNMLQHSQEQTRSLEEHLTQSFNLLHMHLRALAAEHPDLSGEPQQLKDALVALQHKLPYLRSLSALDAQGTVVISNPGGQPGAPALSGAAAAQGGAGHAGRAALWPSLARARLCRRQPLAA